MRIQIVLRINPHFKLKLSRTESVFQNQTQVLSSPRNLLPRSALINSQPRRRGGIRLRRTSCTSQGESDEGNEGSLFIRALLFNAEALHLDVISPREKPMACGILSCNSLNCAIWASALKLTIS